MDHLGIQEFFFMGYCIGGPFALKLMERAPDRVVAGVLCQPVGHRPELPDHMYNGGRNNWAPELLARRPDLTMETIEAYLHNLFRVQPDFVYSVSRDFVRSCQTPMLVMPDDTPGHPYQVSMDIAALAPKAEVTIYPWKEPKDLWVKTVQQVRDFLKAHQPVTGRPLSQMVWRRSTAPPRPPGERMWRTAERVSSAHASVSDGIGHRGLATTSAHGHSSSTGINEMDPPLCGSAVISHTEVSATDHSIPARRTSPMQHELRTVAIDLTGYEFC